MQRTLRLESMGAVVIEEERLPLQTLKAYSLIGLSQADLNRQIGVLSHFEVVTAKIDEVFSQENL